jgi:acetyl esterase/lipase
VTRKVHPTARFGWLISGLLVVAVAEAQTSERPPPLAIAAPSETHAVRLFDRPVKGRPEQWEKMGDSRIVRNVRSASLTPFLPARERATGAAVIIVPGGAFLMLSMDSEGYDVARWLSERGVAAFVLKYRLKESPRDPRAYVKVLGEVLSRPPQPSSTGLPQTPSEAVEDAQKAIEVVRSNADSWHIDPRRVGMLGFSAGAMTTLSVALGHYGSVRPDFIALIYGPMNSVDVPSGAPPMFAALAADDPLFGRNGLGLVASWQKAGRPVEAHLYERGGHGFGMRQQGLTSDLWIDQFYRWVQDRGLLRGSN